MKALSSWLTAALLSAAAAGAGAQTQSPGLWENTIAFKSQSGEMEKAMEQMQKQLAAMPPDQRKQMEQMMASRGMSMGAKGTTVKVCVTPEDIARRSGPKMGNGNCTQDVVERSSSTMKVKWQCTGANPSNGEGEISFSSDKAYTGKAVVTTTSRGKPETMNIEQSGHWLAADCGELKPKAAAKP